MRRVHHRPSTEASSAVAKLSAETMETHWSGPEEEEAVEAQERRTPTEGKRESAWMAVNEVDEEDIKEEIKRLKQEQLDVRKASQEYDERLCRLEDAFANIKRSR